MEVSHWLNMTAKSLDGVIQAPYKSLASALEIIPHTIASYCGANTIRTLTALRFKHAEGDNSSWGSDGLTGKIEDMKSQGILESLSVKL